MYLILDKFNLNRNPFRDSELYLLSYNAIAGTIRIALMTSELS